MHVVTMKWMVWLSLVVFSSCVGINESYRLLQCTRYSRVKTKLMATAGKGFGAAKPVGMNNLLPLTRTSEYRRVDGSFAKLLASVSEVFEQLRPIEGVAKDVYVRLANTEICWFVGKVTFRSGMNITPESAVLYYYILICEYAKALRPKELAIMQKGSESALQIWLAPGNTEMDVAKNVANLELLLPPCPLEQLPPLTEISKDIGYEPEIYMNKEAGFRVKRDMNGKPLANPFEVKFASPAELEAYQKQQKQG